MRIVRSFRVLILGPKIALGFGWMVHLVCLLACLVVLNFVLCHSSVSGTFCVFLFFSTWALSMVNLVNMGRKILIIWGGGGLTALIDSNVAARRTRAGRGQGL